jgi:protocatechuate 3,4-dioxygenase beta subunit
MDVSRQLLQFTVSILVLCPSLALAQDTVRYTGLVVDALGRPVEGAVVSVYGESHETASAGGQRLAKRAETHTSADGRYALEDPAGWQDVSCVFACTPGSALSWAAPEPYLLLQLGKPRKLAGVVVDANDHPIAGAKVSLLVKNEFMMSHQPALPVPGPWGITRTDENGRFVFGGVPAETTADFKVEAPGRVAFWTSSDSGLAEGEHYQVGQTDIRIVLPAAARIEGEVADEDSGRPVPGVHVWIQPRKRQSPYDWADVASADPNGRFIISDVMPGSYEPQVFPAGGQEQCRFGSASVQVEAGQVVRDVHLPVRSGATIEVQTADTNDVPLDGLRVTASSASFKQTIVTDAQGRAVFHLPAGRYTISAFKSGYGGITPGKAIDIERSQTHRETIRIIRSFVTAAGSVVTPNGRPVARAIVTTWPFNNACVTDTDGRFQHTYYHIPFPSKAELLVRDPSSGRACLGQIEDPHRSGKPTGRLTLEPAYTLSGRVTDPDDAGVPHARVRLIAADTRRSPRRCVDLGSSLADANGAYVIRGVPSVDSRYYFVVAAHAPGFNENSIDPVPLEGPVERPVRLDPIILEPAVRTISGVVFDANDKPTPGAIVETPLPYDEDLRQPRRRVLTDANGRFQIDGVCAGPAELVAWSPDKQHGTTYAAGGDENIKIVLGQTLGFARYLKGTPLPRLKELGLSGDLDGKAILLCLVDIEQRPCRHALDVLAQRVEELAKRGVAVRAVQLAPGTSEEISRKAQDYHVTLPLATVAGEPEEVKQTLGVQSLPWLILVDARRTVRADGFALPDLDHALESLDLR